MEKLTDDARKKIEDHLAANKGVPPDHLPQVESVRPWPRGVERLKSR